MSKLRRPPSTEPPSAADLELGIAGNGMPIKRIPAHSPTPLRVSRKLRPRHYTPELSREVCKRLMLGESLSKICEDPRMPSLGTITRWLADTKMADFRNEYYNARRIQAEVRIDEIFDIADESRDDWAAKYGPRGEFLGYVPNNETVRRAQLRIDTRKWYAHKMLPALYGENSQLTLGVTGQLAQLLRDVSNRSTGLPDIPPQAQRVEADEHDETPEH